MSNLFGRGRGVGHWVCLCAHYKFCCISPYQNPCPPPAPPPPPPNVSQLSWRICRTISPELCHKFPSLCHLHHPYLAFSAWPSRQFSKLCASFLEFFFLSCQCIQGDNGAAGELNWGKKENYKWQHQRAIGKEIKNANAAELSNGDAMDD